ncbi:MULTISPECIES: metal-dependent hydrolase [Rhodomicrobium]|uniref:metal-dependent hydrolase n=1 Tax=Rhodomicrobium TaxID=1068 RepID=UPI000B4BE711|nr:MULTISPECIES: metal-dependent hydrolase [Rhodomicrobium]
MADFATHLGWGAVGAGLAASATYAAAIVPSGDLLTLTVAGVIGSVLPDIDLEKAVPSRALFTGLGLVLAFVVLFNFKATYSIIELWLIWTAVFTLIRFGAYHLFHRTAIHRGIFHSLLAGLFFMALTTIIIAYGFGREPVVAWMAGLFVFFGYLIHLLLDEIYSVDITGARIKRSFGTALKLFDWNSRSSSALMAGALVACLMITPPSADFRHIMQPSVVSHFFRERMFPQNGWFQSRMADTASIPGERRAASAGDAAARPE